MIRLIRQFRSIPVVATLALFAIASGCDKNTCDPNSAMYQEGIKGGRSEAMADVNKLSSEQLFNAGQEAGFNDGYQEGYSKAYSAAYKISYQQGLGEGKAAGLKDPHAIADGGVDGYNQGKTDALPIGEYDGYQDGYTDGYNSGFPMGQTSCYYSPGSGSSEDTSQVCYLRGRNSVYMDAYNSYLVTKDEYVAGYAAGKAQGLTEGVAPGASAGNADGKKDGYNAGFVDGAQMAYQSAYDYKYPDGYQDGYATGYNDRYRGYGEAPTSNYDSGTGGYGDGFNDGFVDGRNSTCGPFPGARRSKIVAGFSAAPLPETLNKAISALREKLHGERKALASIAIGN